MNMLFEEIKSYVSVHDVMRLYHGWNGEKFIICPLHPEKIASFHIREKTFYCFSCGVGGDVIKLVEILFNLSPYQAANRISLDFNINFKNDKDKIKKIRTERFNENECIKKTEKLMIYYNKLLDIRINTISSEEDLENQEIQEALKWGGEYGILWQRISEFMGGLIDPPFIKKVNLRDHQLNFCKKHKIWLRNLERRFYNENSNS